MAQKTQDIEDPAIKQALRNDQGVALTKALKFLGDEHVDIFRQRQVGDYIVSLASEEAEGMYTRGSSGLDWQTPAKDQNQHVELVVQDAADLRFVPYLNPTVTITDKDDKPVVEAELDFLWHPVISHYGVNVQLPKSTGPFSYRIRFEPPSFARHDEALGDRLTDSVDITFSDMEPEPEREPHGPE